MNSKHCAFPGCTEKETMLFKCKLCGGYYCAKHRLPERHNCPMLSYYQSDDYKHRKVGINTEVNKAIKDDHIKITRPNARGGDNNRPKKIFFDKEHKFLARSSFLTLYSFDVNFFNIIIPIVIISLVIWVHSLIQYLTVSHNFNVNLLLLGLMIFGEVFLIYGGHELIHYVVGQYMGVKVKNALWVQGLIFSLIAIIFPIFIFPPSLLVLRNSLVKKRGKRFFTLTDQSDNKSMGLTAMFGSLWLLFWAITFAVISFSKLLLSSHSLFVELVYVSSPMLAVLLFSLLLFHLLPVFPLTDGIYVYKWKSTVAWLIWSGNLMIYIIYLIFYFIIY